MGRNGNDTCNYCSKGIGGGTYGTVALDTVYLGSGGGGGVYLNNGASGGGAIVLNAGFLNVQGGLQAIGGGPANYGGSGSGGSILLKVGTGILGTNLVNATGGPDAVPNGQAGGSGGDGRIAVQYAKGYSGVTAPIAYTLNDANSDNISITKQLLSQTNFLGTNLLLTVGFTTISPYTLQWYFNGAIVPGATTQSLSLSNLALTNQGYYRVTVSGAAMTLNSSNAYLTVLDIRDFDNDGIPNWWELQYGLNPNSNLDATTHPPGDKLTYLQKYLYGLNPLTIDTDGDGLSDYDELFICGTDPLKADTDGDGMSDAWEVQHGLNPLVNDANVEISTTGVTYGQVYQYNLTHTNQLDPRNPFFAPGTSIYEAINEGQHTNRFYYDREDRLVGAEYSRGIAIAYTYDGNGNIVRQTVLSRASETNGLPVLWQFLNGLTNASPYADTDGDGWSNYQEWLAGSSPTNAASKPDLLGLAGTNLASLSVPVAVSNFGIATGQLDGLGAEEIVIGADGNLGTNTNFLLVLTQGPASWATQRVDVGPFGITSIAVGQLTNRPSAGIYVGLRGTTNSRGRILEFTSNGGIWQSNVVALSTNETGFVLGINSHKQIVFSVASSSNGPSLLEAYSSTGGTFTASLLATNWSSDGVGSVGQVFSRTIREAYAQLKNLNQIQVFASPFEYTANGLLLPTNTAQDPNDGKWHFRLEQSLDWPAARSALSPYGSDLVIITNAQKNSWLFAQYPTAGWIGITFESGQGRWVDGSQVDQGYQNWYDLNPQDGPARRGRMEAAGNFGQSRWHATIHIPSLPSLAQVNTAIGTYSNRWDVNSVQIPTGGVDSARSQPVLASFRVGQTNSSSLILAHVPSHQPGENGSVIHQFELVEWRISGNEVTTNTLFQAAHSLTTDSVKVALTLAEFESGRGKRLFTGEPDGQVFAWTATDSTNPLQRQLFSGYHAGKAWHALSAIKTFEPGEGLVGLRVDANAPNACSVIFWPPQSQLPQSIPVSQTAPLARILPVPNTGGALATVRVRLWDAEGNAALPFLQYQRPGTTNWLDATLVSAGGSAYSSATRVATLPTGLEHDLVWNAGRALGAGFTNTILLRAHASDVTLTGDYSASTPYRVEISGGNPMANPDGTNTLQGLAVDINVLANDTVENGLSLTIASFTQPAGGVVSRGGGGMLRYQPAANYFGQDSFTYTISDGVGGTSTATVTVVIHPTGMLRLASPQFLPGRVARIVMTSPDVGARFELHSSTDLRTWTPVSTNANTAGTLEFIHTVPDGEPRRFYRAVLVRP